MIVLGLWKGQVWGTRLCTEPEVVLFTRSAGLVKRETHYRLGPFWF